MAEERCDIVRRRWRQGPGRLRERFEEASRSRTTELLQKRSIPRAALFAQDSQKAEIRCGEKIVDEEFPIHCRAETQHARGHGQGKSPCVARGWSVSRVLELGRQMI